jgi:hypothetical protein
MVLVELLTTSLTYAKHGSRWAEQITKAREDDAKHSHKAIPATRTSQGRLPRLLRAVVTIKRLGR